MVKPGTGLGANLLAPLEPCCTAHNTSDTLNLFIPTPGFVCVCRITRVWGEHAAAHLACTSFPDTSVSAPTETNAD